MHLELLTLDDGVVGRGSRGRRSGSAGAGSGRAAVWGRTDADVAALLARTAPDPAAVPFLAHEPDERWQRVAAAG